MAVFNIKKILVPVDFSKTSLKALDYAVEISKLTKAEIILMHVSEGLFQNLEPGYIIPPIAMLDYQTDFIKQSKKHLTDIADKISRKKTGEVTTLTVAGNIRTEILDAAKNNKVDLIVMGTHGVSGVKEFFTGSNTFRVIRDAVCPVLSVQKKGSTPFFQNILVPFRDKPHSREKVNYALEIAMMFSSTIHILGVDTEFTASHKRKIEREAEQIKNIAVKNGIKCTTKIIESTYAGDVVLKHALSKNADLIVSMADLDKMDIAEYFIGPFAQQIVNHSPIPVLNIRPKFNPDTIDLSFY